MLGTVSGTPMTIWPMPAHQHGLLARSMARQRRAPRSARALHRSLAVQYRLRVLLRDQFSRVHQLLDALRAAQERINHGQGGESEREAARLRIASLESRLVQRDGQTDSGCPPRCARKSPACYP
jgi:hypothetical protein